jgi:hypothetical protein
MFVDDRSTWPRPEPAPRRPSRQERVLSRLALAYALVLLLAPISLGSAVDLLRYLAGLLGG